MSSLIISGVIAIDQDPAGVQGWQVQGSVSANGEAFEKPLSDGSYAIALLNRGSTAQVVATSTVAATMPAAASYHVLNVWSGARSNTTGALTATVPAYSTVLLRVSAAK